MLSVLAGSVPVEDVVDVFSGHTLGSATGAGWVGTRGCFARRVVRVRNFGVAAFFSCNVLEVRFFVFISRIFKSFL
jgi:hypothetical protein